MAGGRGGERKLTAPYDVERKETFKGIIQNHFVPMHLTPFRMSFLGGGTDFPAYFNEYGGCVLSATFNKYSYVTVRELPALFDYKNQFTYSKIERFNSPDELEHPLVREALKYIDIDRVQIAYDADLPARS